MKREQLHHLRSRILDKLSYLGVYAPALPAEDETTLSEQRDALITMMAEHRSTLRSEDQSSWHRLAEEELPTAFEAYSSGDDRRGSDQIQRAEEHFRRSFKPKRIKPDFII